MNRIITLAIMVLIAASTFAQDEEKKLPSIEFSGWINAETVYDTRQVEASREGEIFMYPKPIDNDINGKDINANGKLSMFTFMSRIRGKISPVEAFGAKTTGLLEVDLLGTGTNYVNMFRLRHAYVNMDWNNKVALLFGQTWHPMFVTECFPEVVYWGAGLPVHVLNRSPQIRFTYNFTPNFNLLLAAVMQHDFSSTGPNGASAEYLRNSKMPEAQLRLMYNSDAITVGGTFGVKTLVPRLTGQIVDTLNVSHKVAVDESITTFNSNVFVAIKAGDLRIKVQGIYGQDLHNYVMISGYGVSEINPVTGEWQYAPLQTGSAWAEVIYSKDKFDLALFGGITKNFGSKKDFVGGVYARGKYTNLKNETLYIDNMIYVAPRAALKSGKMRFVLEPILSSAAWGKPDAKYKVENTERATNLRLNFSVFRYF